MGCKTALELRTQARPARQLVELCHRVHTSMKITLSRSVAATSDSSIGAKASCWLVSTSFGRIFLVQDVLCFLRPPTPPVADFKVLPKFQVADGLTEQFAAALVQIRASGEGLAHK